MSRVILTFLTYGSLAIAQPARDDWKAKRFVTGELTRSLADAPLTARERAQIYRVVDNATNQYSLPDPRKDKQREVVMSSPVGSIELALNGSKQVLVRGPDSFCGTTGNCPIWIFIRQGGQLRLALQSGTNGLIVRKTSSRGFHDLAAGWHWGAFDEQFRVYRWDGARYRQVDCYEANYPQSDRNPIITACP